MSAISSIYLLLLSIVIVSTNVAGQGPQHLKSVLNPKLDDESLDIIEKHLSQGRIIVIQNALEEGFANATYEALQSLQYEKTEDYQPTGYHHVYHRSSYKDQHQQHNWPDTLGKAVDSIFYSPDTKQWISDVTNRDTSGPPDSVEASEFRPDDYTHPATAFVGQRTVAWKWILAASDWKRFWGGALYWCPEENEHAWIHAEFNTLVLFSVTNETSHFVTTVNSAAAKHGARRLELSGYWTSSWMPDIDADDDILEKVNTWKKNNYTSAQLEQLEYIYHESNDEKLRSGMDHLIDSIEDERERLPEYFIEFDQIENYYEAEEDDDDEDDDEDEDEDEDEDDGDEL